MGNLKGIKAMFLDVDGTLTNSSKQITEVTRNAIKRVKDKGIYVILCSGEAIEMYVNIAKMYVHLIILFHQMEHKSIIIKLMKTSMRII